MNNRKQKIQKTLLFHYQLDGCIVGNAHNTVIGSKSSAISNTWVFGPIRDLNADGISIVSAVYAGITRWQTDRQTTLLGR